MELLNSQGLVVVDGFLERPGASDGGSFGDFFAFLPQVAGSLLQDGKVGGLGAGSRGTKQVTFLLFSPKSLGHFYETANLEGLES